jgi:hypothetical protein
MKIFEHKGRILRTLGLIAALAVASLPVTKAEAYCNLEECYAACPPLFSPGHFPCIAACNATCR